ncbi:expressed unknown protein [Seminavis robusta]|uniref:Uncharacterized protein n=1 Tax=Seminavis robusta TaxID=568900 RepID=A0A9N8EN02_9STRA|nr:expressed unknown protein [Seminavis robusta]|eukprot:Sro1494_g277360.1 n/a (99) ;mRNA; f:17063-17438
MDGEETTQHTTCNHHRTVYHQLMIASLSRSTRRNCTAQLQPAVVNIYAPNYYNVPVIRFHILRSQTFQPRLCQDSILERHLPPLAEQNLRYVDKKPTL